MIHAEHIATLLENEKCGIFTYQRIFRRQILEVKITRSISQDTWERIKILLQMLPMNFNYYKAGIFIHTRVKEKTPKKTDKLLDFGRGIGYNTQVKIKKRKYSADDILGR